MIVTNKILLILISMILSVSACQAQEYNPTYNSTDRKEPFYNARKNRDIKERNNLWYNTTNDHIQEYNPTYDSTDTREPVSNARKNWDIKERTNFWYNTTNDNDKK
ncbi:MAG: hypothetical protein K1X44_00505 [Alphaproteobacteria bacterium]|nr:hypothetical protein [Alphaproteobacteria bacterium]